MHKRLTIAVTGLDATDHPGPGVSVIRALRHAKLDARIVGLCHDALEAGIYARDLCDDVFLVPRPSEGSDPLASRLAQIHLNVALDIIIPTLDHELPLYVELEERLGELGVGMFLPTRAQLAACASAEALGSQARQEVCVVAVGDGRGGCIGSVPMKRTFVSEDGAGWAGITIRDHQLDALTDAFMAETRWRGPCEIVLVRDEETGYRVTAIHPRFPSWVYLAAGAGTNLPLALVYLAAGGPTPVMGTYRVGTMFVRTAVDQIADLETVCAISMEGELHRDIDRKREVA